MSEKNDKQKDLRDKQRTYDRCLKKFEDFNMKLAEEEGFFISVVNRPTFEAFPVNDEVKELLKEKKKKKPLEGIGSL